MCTDDRLALTIKVVVGKLLRLVFEPLELALDRVRAKGAPTLKLVICIGHGDRGVGAGGQGGGAMGSSFLSVRVETREQNGSI
jgi:hypothetical protein